MRYQAPRLGLRNRAVWRAEWSADLSAGRRRKSRAYGRQFPGAPNLPIAGCNYWARVPTPRPSTVERNWVLTTVFLVANRILGAPSWDSKNS